MIEWYSLAICHSFWCQEGFLEVSPAERTVISGLTDHMTKNHQDDFENIVSTVHTSIQVLSTGGKQ